jgi:hypothetical protein
MIRILILIILSLAIVFLALRWIVKIFYTHSRETEEGIKKDVNHVEDLMGKNVKDEQIK